ncbi:DUF1998 domain-containing protein [Halomicronema sp. CCY15110]|uniref:DUF1998 domain-containing protein n=1 Tax=Halomicronema sp. CCY15110 TaxID=2767773 RepID=UPI00195231BF|nr:DUF1998 domain-containing protein [Halomicronema sp. CCY15110]
MTASPYKHRVGELRPSQILFTYGIGAIADLPNLSAMVMGLEGWDKTRTTELNEERLLAAVRQELGSQIKDLRSPPIPPDADGPIDPFDEVARIGVPVAPFPTWMVCPRCRLLAPLQSGLFELKTNPYRPNEARYVHKNCPRAKKSPTVIPSRFLVACEHGHLDDFPWHYFVHRGPSDCKGSLRFEEYGVTGAATDIMVRCDGCDAKARRLSEAFGESGKQNMPCCRGRHPHIQNFDEDCSQQMRGMLLGASNSWFGITLSALSIPVASNQLAQLVQQNWDVLGKSPNLEMLQFLLSTMQGRGEFQEFVKYSIEDVWKTIESIQQGYEELDAQDLKTPEWEVFSLSVSTQNTTEFQLRPVAPPLGYESYFDKVVLVERLREVRALVGFTRIQSPGDFDDTGAIPAEYRAPISRNAPLWAPASEVKGEGIFLQFEESVLRNWENQTLVYQRGQRTREAQKQWLRARNLDPSKIPFPGMRYLLMHSFAHALMRQLAIECGYNAASLRERIYSKQPNEVNGPQAGVLIYTAAPDSEGTLGGLVSLGEPKTLGYHIAQALIGMRLCASDPLCADHKPNLGAPSLHWAACHACLFSPETSCERGNKYLDRSLLVTTFADKDLAFFRE